MARSRCTAGRRGCARASRYARSASPPASWWSRGDGQGHMWRGRPVRHTDAGREGGGNDVRVGDAGRRWQRDGCRRSYRQRLERERLGVTEKTYKHLEDGPWMVIPGVHPAPPDQPSCVSLVLRHDHGLQVDVLLPASAAEQIARNIIEAARAVRTGETPNFAPRRSAT